MSARAHTTIADAHPRFWIGQQSALQILLFILTFLLYLATLTSVHTFDALSYVTSVERKPWTAVFHPHHLAYGPVGAVALQLGQLFGYTGGAALPMQLL